MTPRTIGRALGFVAFVGLGGLCACDDKIEFAGPQPASAIVRLVNATNAPLDFSAGGQVTRENTAIGFGGSSSCTLVQTTPQAVMGVLFAGTSSQLPGMDVEVLPSSRVTIVAWPGTSGTRFLGVRNAFTPAEGSAGLNVVNVTGGSGRYDAYVTAPGATSLGAARATSIASGTSSSYFNVTGGAQQVRLTSAGSQAVALDAGSATFSPATTQTLVVAPAADGAAIPRFFWVSGC